MALKIYTKTGDKGRTSLLGGTKVSKANLRIEAYGTVDELNSFMGLLIDQLALHEAGIDLSTPREIQDRLFTIGSTLACDPEKEIAMQLPGLHEEDVLLLEKEIDAMNAELPEMRSFILPGGHVAVSTAHVVRCVCRRAERNCVHLQEESGHVDELVIKYLNRLSDYLFILARFIGMKLHAEEVAWKARKSQ